MKTTKAWSCATVGVFSVNVLLWVFLGIYSLTLKPTFANLDGYYNDDYDRASYEAVYDNSPDMLKPVVPAYHWLMVMIEPFDEGERGASENLLDLAAIAILAGYVYLRMSSKKEFKSTGKLLRTESQVLFVLDLLIMLYLVVGIALIVPLTV